MTTLPPEIAEIEKRHDTADNDPRPITMTEDFCSRHGSQAHHDRAALLAFIKSSLHVPHGWKLVPRKPTKAMSEAHFKEAIACGGTAPPSLGWMAMHDAAPEPPNE